MKWKARKPSGRAFHSAYGVEVETIDVSNPFVADILTNFAEGSDR